MTITGKEALSDKHEIFPQDAPVENNLYTLRFRFEIILA